jgi:hypothetical protein
LEAWQKDSTGDPLWNLLPLTNIATRFKKIAPVRILEKSSFSLWSLAELDQPLIPSLSSHSAVFFLWNDMCDQEAINAFALFPNTCHSFQAHSPLSYSIPAAERSSEQVRGDV